MDNKFVEGKAFRIIIIVAANIENTVIDAAILTIYCITIRIIYNIVATAIYSNTIISTNNNE